MMNKLAKKVAIVIAAATMALTGTTMAVSANDGMGIEAVTPGVTVQDMNTVKYVAVSEGANVRTAPSTSAHTVNTLGMNTRVQVTGKTSNGWYQVIASDSVYGGEGAYYIYGELLSDSTKSAAPAAETTYQEYMDNHYASDAEVQSHMARSYAKVCVDSSYLALRSEPTYAYENEIEQLHNGDMVQIAGDTCGSYVTVYTEAGNYGWVNAGFLQ